MMLAAVPSDGTAQGSTEGSGSIGVRLVTHGGPSDDPRSDAYIVDHVEPGAVLERRIEASNASTEPQRIDLYAAAAGVEDDVFTASEGRGRNDLTDWTLVEPSSVDLAPGATASVDVTIDVPEHASRGERYAAVMAEAASVDGSGVRQIHRVGVRVYLSVGPGGEPSTDFRIDDLELAGSADRPALVARVTNTGERAVDLAGSATLAYEGGTLTAGPFEFQAGTTIVPGDSGRVAAELDEPLAAGPWLATAVLRSGDVERTAQLTLDLPGIDADAEPDSPWAAILIALAAVLAAIVLIRHLSHRKSDAP
ncbi:hypothetical protein [Glycomyces sp. YM15]|uniref:hypothetical protein n=1 Tax=Glycomyces sp. YM15 TaxID=2800446 RepID=UPI001964F251|nr:hypothetical protein [Glycomyces sp. YM15]